MTSGFGRHFGSRVLVFVGPPGGGTYIFSHFAVVHKVSEVFIIYLNFLPQIWLTLLTRMPESCAVVFFLVWFTCSRTRL